MKLNKKSFILLNAVSFLLILFGLGAFNLLGTHSAGLSELEQRNLAQTPTFTWNKLFKGEYARELESYFSDNFVFRSSLVQAGAELKGLKGLPEKNGVSILERGDNTASSSVTGSDKVKYLIMNNQAVTLFNYSAEAGKQYATAINTFKASINANVRVYSMLAPSAAAFLDDSKYRDMSDSQKDAFNAIYKQLAKGVTGIDAYSALEQHRSEYIYFRTDHHWTALGAYYAYTQLMKTIGEKPHSLSNYKKGTITGFLGSSYKATLSSSLKSHPDTITYYVPDGGYTYTIGAKKSASRQVVDPHYATAGNGYYAVFLGGDFPQGEILSGNENGKRLVVVKDSYANAFIPFLIPHFEEIDIIDPRTYKGNLAAFVKNKKITDVLFLNSSTAARTTSWAQLLNTNLGMSGKKA
ncbi:DHHW motif protein [Paenibacillus taihuensis]|uniref:DHHW motif protein n=1 Tax=Paenibacillus taihuensis TaxID=1156355 RepID=A0A3D9SC70_9BACL|nr:DHHW family protein [Paenibacillus taihuensis]REE88918.1 DHHW motif protein [Paenibacillus taihuensis]